MLEKTKAFFRKDLPFWPFCICIVLVVLAKLTLGYLQMTYIWVGGAPIDDELMFAAANSISSGEWLGDYTWLTLSKQMFFAVWLAVCNLLHVPYLMAGQALLCVASFAMMKAFSPVIHSCKYQLLLFAVLCGSPAASASFTLRVYRDNIFPSLCVLFFAGIIGAALRYKRARRIARPWLVLAGVGLGLACVTREDGIWLLPFAMVGTVITIFFIGNEKGLRHKFGRMLMQAKPYLVAVVFPLLFCGLNYFYYGIFATSDFSQGAFTEAYGAMTQVAYDETATEVSLVPVPYKTREQLYQAVPEFAVLKPYLETDKAGVRTGYYNEALGDYQAGAFYWVLRKAASEAGMYQDAQTAQDYWQSVADGIENAIAAGTLSASIGARSSTTPIITSAHVLPTIGETMASFWYSLTFQDTSVYDQTQRSIVSAEDAALWNDYLGSKANYAAVAGGEAPYYAPLQLLCYTCFNLLRYLYMVGMPILFGYACYLQGKKWCQLCHAKNATGLDWLLWFILFGVFCMAWLRCAMIAFMEVAAFQIGTYVMYLASVHPLLIVFAVGSVCTANFYEKQNQGEPVV